MGIFINIFSAILAFVAFFATKYVVGVLADQRASHAVIYGWCVAGGMIAFAAIILSLGGLDAIYQYFEARPERPYELLAGETGLWLVLTLVGLVVAILFGWIGHDACKYHDLMQDRYAKRLAREARRELRW
ncbi:hypothetical protein IJG89_02705 [Candidatus Saccharibacteria bacterium]|nr:hypothetical protein [Candidatus Saccharibacteria bacterium]